MNVEVRAGLPAEYRAETGIVTVGGYAAVFNERTEIGDMWAEIIAPGAFAEALSRRDDVVFLINHEGLPLARSESGTLALSEDSRGLSISAELRTDDPDVQSIVPKMERGDLNKMSFSFRVEREEWDETGDIPVRTIHQVELRDVSIVTRPAYQGTDIALRSLEAFQNANPVRNQNMRIQRLRQAELRSRIACDPAGNARA